MKGSNKMKKIKMITIILAIILISMIGFFGLYTRKQNRIEDNIKEYSYAMDLNGGRIVTLEANSKQENLTTENYKKVKDIIEKRLNKLSVQNYEIRLNEQTGKIEIKIEENSDTDNIVSNIGTVGKFELIDADTKEVLMNNEDIKTAEVLYGSDSSTTNGVTVYLSIEFNKEGKNKLLEISNKYVGVEEDEEEANVEDKKEETVAEEKEEEKITNKVTMKIDGEEIMTSGFDEPLTTGMLQLSVGGTATDEQTLKENVRNAQNFATVLGNGNLPLKYEVTGNKYVLSSIEKQDLINIGITFAIVIAISLIVLIIKYKLNGFVSGISFIGLISTYLLVIRYANVVISMQSIFGIGVVLILNYIFIDNLLKRLKDTNVSKAINETYKEFFVKIIPVCIMAITFCFIKWIPINSFGMIMFWGIALIALYNIIITRTLLKIKTDK